MEAKGKTGTIILSDGVVTIKRRGSVGWSASTGAVEIRLPVSEIVAIQIREAPLLGIGAIRFVVANENSVRRTSDDDDDVITFSHRQNAMFTALAAEVAKSIAKRTRSVAC